MRQGSMQIRRGSGTSIRITNGQEFLDACGGVDDERVFTSIKKRAESAIDKTLQQMCHLWRNTHWHFKYRPRL